jgi:hypothetical protein
MAGYEPGDCAGCGSSRGADRGMAFLSPEMEKAAHEAAFFFFYSISSEYQIERINPPNIFESIVVEVAWNQGQNFRTERKKLDRFSTFGENSWELGAGSWEPGAGSRELGAGSVPPSPPPCCPRGDSRRRARNSEPRAAQPTTSPRPGMWGTRRFLTTQATILPGRPERS